MATRQFTGKTVVEATDLALETLKLNREEVEIVVVNPGRSGILGFGGEPAVIQVTPLATPEPSRAVQSPREAAAESSEPRRPSRNGRRGRRSSSENDGQEAPAEAPRSRKASVKEETAAPVEAPASTPTAEAPPTPVAAESPAPAAATPPARAQVETASPETEGEEEERQPGPDPEVEACATEILDRFLGSLGVVASTYIREEVSDGTVAFDIEGEDAGLLIGRRGETLQALQFLVNLMVSKELGRQAYVTIDVEGYRERRYESLRTLARRTASRVSSSGRQFALQPMSAGERRIIHLTLADHPSVRTESRGEGDQRRVVVLPK